MTNWVSNPRAGKAVDHIALRPTDMERSLVFYRDGLGLEVLNDLSAEGDYSQFFGVASTSLRSIFLGDREHPWAGKLELVTFEGAAVPPMPPTSTPYLLLSFAVDVRAAATRIESMGFDPVNVVEHRGAHLGITRDPDGALIELVELVPEPE